MRSILCDAIKLETKKEREEDNRTNDIDYQKKYLDLKSKVDTFYARMVMYIGNNIMIEQEELDIDYIFELVENLNLPKESKK